jgi:hypothetical protein
VTVSQEAPAVERAAVVAFLLGGLQQDIKLLPMQHRAELASLCEHFAGLLRTAP